MIHKTRKTMHDGQEYYIFQLSLDDLDSEHMRAKLYGWIRAEFNSLPRGVPILVDLRNIEALDITGAFAIHNLYQAFTRNHPVFLMLSTAVDDFFKRRVSFNWDPQLVHDKDQFERLWHNKKKPS